MDRKPHRSKLMLGGAVAWLAVAALALVQLWDPVPASSAQWLLFILLAPPIYIVGEWFFGWVFSKQHGNSISGRRFSFVRVVVAVAIFAGLFAFSWWVVWLLK